MTATHGLATFGKSRAYTAWKNMRQRCLNKNRPGYQYWGGRGIKICARWEKFENFLADMGEPSQGMTIDRFPNNDGNYEPSNCRWATTRQNANNTRRSLIPRYSAKDIAGMTFGRLIAVRYSHQNKARTCVWVCECSCGNSALVTTSSLLSARTRSCGCLRREVARKTSKMRHQTGALSHDA